MEKHLLRIHSDSIKVEHATISEAGAISQTTWHADLSDVLPQLVQQDVILIAPGVDILALEKTLPKMPANKLLRAVPYAIEEQLLDPVDTYHFIVPFNGEDGTTDILAVLRTDMEHWLAPFLKNRTFCKALIPEYLLLPFEPSAWHVAIEDNAIVRTGKFQGFCCDIELLPALLAVACQQVRADLKPENIILHNFKKHLPWSITDFDIPGTLITLQDEPGALLNLMAPQWQLDLEPANLLQGPYAQEQHLAKVKKLWLLTGSVAAAAVLMAFISSVVQFIVLKHQDNLLQEKITTIYKQIYPQATTVVSPQARIERTLKDLQNGQLGGGYLGLLTLAGNALRTMPDIIINTIQYQDNKLVFNVKANNFEQLDQALKKLNQAGINAKQDEGTTKDNYVTARFTIQENQ